MYTAKNMTVILLLCSYPSLITSTTQADCAGTEPHVFVANENVPNGVRELNTLTDCFERSYNHDAWQSDGSGRYLAFAGSGSDCRLWVTDDPTQSIYQFDIGGCSSKSYVVNTPESINDIEYYSGNGMLYALTMGPSGSSSHLVEIDLVTGSQTTRLSWGSGFQAHMMGFGPDGYLYITRFYGDLFAARVYDPENNFNFVREIPLPGHGDPDAYRLGDVTFVGDYFYLASNDGIVGDDGWIDEYLIADGSWIRTVYTSPGAGMGGLAHASETSLWATCAVEGYGTVAEIEISTGNVLRVLSQCDICGVTNTGNIDIEVKNMFDWNDNGTSDRCDIACGNSADLNRNWIPDECEDSCPGDLTGDGIVDINDIFEILGLWGACP